MSLLLSWLSLAFAGGVADYPYQAELALPRSGIVQINVPLELRDPANDRSGADLLLVDATGAGVPFAVVNGNPNRVTVSGRKGLYKKADLSWEPDRSSDGSRYDVLVTSRALDGLNIRLTSVPAAADVRLSRIEDDGSTTLLIEKRIFRLSHGDDTDLPTLLEPGKYRVDIQVLQRGLFEVPSIDGYRLSGPRLKNEVRTVNLGPPEMQENGITLYDLSLPQGLPIDWVRLDPTADIFDREASVTPFLIRDELPGTLAPEHDLHSPRPIQRIAIGSANVSMTTIDVTDRANSGHYTVMVRGQPMDMRDAEVGATGIAILARDPGPGPHVLYGGSVQMAPDQDMQFAAEELARNVSKIVRADGVEPNPRWEAPDPPSMGIGREFDDQGLRFARAIQGTGLVRIPLDDHILTNARSDLGDLRLRTPNGHQVAYALRRSAEVGVANDLSFERVERGGQSHIEVILPQGGLPLQHLTLHTEEGSFDRQVTVSRKSGKRTNVLRSVQWRSRTNPKILRMGVGQRVGEKLGIEISNGDDPPLSLTKVDASWSRWEIVANVPTGGCDLRYGDPKRSPANYDAGPALTALTDTELAELGEVEKRIYVAPAMERTATFAGMACVGLGLLGMLGLLIRGAPTEEEDLEAADDEESPIEDAPEPPPADDDEAGESKSEEPPSV